MEDKLGGAFGTCRGEEKCMHSFGGETLWKDDTGRLRLSWKGNIKMDVENRMGGRGLDLSGRGYEHVVGFCVPGSEHSGSIKCGEFLDYLRKCNFAKKNSAPSS